MSTPTQTAPITPTQAHYQARIRLLDAANSAKNSAQVSDGQVRHLTRQNSVTRAVWQMIREAEAMAEGEIQAIETYDALAGRLNTEADAVREAIRLQMNATAAAPPSGLTDPDEWLRYLRGGFDEVFKRLCREEAPRVSTGAELVPRVENRILGMNEGSLRAEVVKLIRTNTRAARAAAQRELDAYRERHQLTVYTLATVPLTDAPGRAAFDSRLAKALEGIAPVPEVAAALAAGGWSYTTRSKPLAEAFAALA